ncbi:M20/M25/M40 family metallo-hydrolase [Dermabacteraceae bacterium P13095]
MTALPTEPRAAVSALLALDTTSVKGTLPVIALLEETFAAAGAQVHRFVEPDGVKANLVASFPAADGSLEGGVLLAGHADCVPVEGQAWTTPPFTPTERDGRIYGRGACDMKAFLALIACVAPEIASARLSEPIHVGVTWDEEVTADGARALVGQLAQLGIHPRIAFVGEPSNMRAIGAHKSMNSFTATFRGIAAHSSLLPRGLNAIRYAAQFIEFFHREVVDELRENGPRDDAYPVPYTTGGVNVVRGGIARNTVPELVELNFEFRALPEIEVAPIVAKIEAEIARLDAEMKAAVPADPASDASLVGAELEIVTLLAGLASGPESEAARYAVRLGAHPTGEKVTYGTEAGIYEAAGMSVVVVGPGDIAQAHAADEYVSYEQLDECLAFLRNLIADISLA